MVEREWQLEIQGELTKQRRIEAIDKLLSVLTLIVASVFGLQAIGLDGATPASCSCLPPAACLLWPQPMTASHAKHRLSSPGLVLAYPISVQHGAADTVQHHESAVS